MRNLLIKFGWYSIRWASGFIYILAGIQTILTLGFFRMDWAILKWEGFFLDYSEDYAEELGFYK